jgi:hypothetical protein
MPTPVGYANTAKARPDLISRRPDGSVGGGGAAFRLPGLRRLLPAFEGLPAQVHPLEVKGGDQVATASA